MPLRPFEMTDLKNTTTRSPTDADAARAALTRHVVAALARVREKRESTVTVPIFDPDTMTSRDHVVTIQGVDPDEARAEATRRGVMLEDLILERGVIAGAPQGGWPASTREYVIGKILEASGIPVGVPKLNEYGIVPRDVLADELNEYDDEGGSFKYLCKLNTALGEGQAITRQTTRAFEFMPVPRARPRARTPRTSPGRRHGSRRATSSRDGPGEGDPGGGEPPPDPERDLALEVGGRP
jgi:hypothetical protein